MRQRQMPVRNYKDSPEAAARRLVEAHPQFLDGNFVSIEQIQDLVKRLADRPARPKAPASASRNRNASPPTMLQRDSLHEMPDSLTAAQPTTVSSVHCAPPPASSAPAKGLISLDDLSDLDEENLDEQDDAALSAFAEAKVSSVAAAGQNEAAGKPVKEKSKGKKKKEKGSKKTKKGKSAEDPSGPSLNSLLGLSSDEDAPPIAPPAGRSSMSSLSDVPSLGAGRRGGTAQMASLKDMPPLF